MRVEHGEQADPDQQADELRADEGGRRTGGDPGEGVGERPADGDGGGGETGGRGEPVRRADVGPDRRGGGGGPAGAGQGEDEQDQARGGGGLAGPHGAPAAGRRGP